ncbi:tetratricopeptide repeat protein [Sphingomonas endolithica]|uniref:tetratricopeptide repeat protein n=1 Tax=Sphingomonas endolithica TaxID=2972485 RepID=UPI0021AE9887|nr:tetratricopeptide repeat protein [Sphingomonas sp. ZFBP2030]
MRICPTMFFILLGTAAVPHLAHAQGNVEVRVDRLEGQMRAVQRKVFPGANGKLIEPDISGQEAVGDTRGTPSGSAVTDLTARVDALESQLSSLTGQIEQNQFKLRQMDEGFTAYKRSTDARLKALEDGRSTGGTSFGGGDEPAPIASSRPSTARPTTRPTPSGTVPSRATPPPVSSTRDPARAQQVAAIEKPSTGDDGEDAYNYGYRLWEAKLYPEAEAQFRSIPKDFPNHRRVSRAQNMLGRALLDSGKPNLAVLAFYDNYRTLPKGDRAHESLYYLAQALTQLKKPASEICKVYDELTDVYPDKLSDAMKTGVARGRAAQKCGK